MSGLSKEAYELLWGSPEAAKTTEAELSKSIDPQVPDWWTDIKSPSQLCGKPIAQMTKQPVRTVWVRPDPRGKAYPPLPVVPRGEVAVLYGLGGAGKTMIGLQMAWSLASRTELFGGPGEGWPVSDLADDSSKILCLLGETSERAIANRFIDLRDELRLSAKALEEVERRLLVAALSHRANPSLVSWGKSQAYEHSEAAQMLAGYLLQKQWEYSLILVDPLVIFGGDDVERDPRATQSLAAFCRKLTRLPGNPSVIILHHANKAAYQSDGTNAANLRGTGAIINSVQCVMEFRRQTAKKTEKSQLPKKYKIRAWRAKKDGEASWVDDDGVVHMVDDGPIGDDPNEDAPPKYELTVVKANEIKPWSITLEQRGGRCYWLVDGE